MKKYLLVIILSFQLSVQAQWVLRPLNKDFGQMSVWFTDMLNGYLTGQDDYGVVENDGGIILVTDNGGISWDTLFNPTGGYNYPADIRFNGNFGITANRTSDIYITTNGGDSWSSIDFDGTDFLYESIDFANPNVVLIAGWSGEVFRISDVGTTIENVFFLGTPYNSIKNLQCRGLDTCYFNNADNLYRTIDAGDTWEAIYPPDDHGIGDFYVYPNNTIMAFQNYELEAPLLIKSVDAGLTWDTIATVGVLEHYYDMAFYDSVGYILGNNYEVLHTTDSGETWNLIHLPSIPEASGILFDIQLLNAETGFIYGDQGLFYTLGINTSIHPEQPTDLITYPNPVDDVLRVISTSLNPIYLYTITGELIAQCPSPCNQINTSQLSAGIYVIKQGNNIKQFVKQ